MTLDPGWFSVSLSDVTRILLCTLGCYVALILWVRINGLRTFSKMSSFDFVVTLAIGSTFATTALSQQVSLGQGAFCLAILIAIQGVVAKLRQRFSLLSNLVDNTPMLLMDGPEILQDNLCRGRITLDDLRAKLREANVTSYDQVLAVVLETTGDIAVLHSQDPNARLDRSLLEGVRRGEGGPGGPTARAET